MVENYKDKIEIEKLMDILPCAVYIIEDSIIRGCNQVALDMFRFERKDEIIGKRPFDLSPKKQEDGSLSTLKGKKLINKALKSKEPVSFKWTHKRKNGECFTTDIELFNNDDILYAVVMDVQEKEKLKEDLDEKDYLYSMLFNNHSSAILLIRPETGEIIDANKSALDYYGYKKEKITSMKIQNINTLSEIQVKNEMKLAAREKRNYFKFIHKIATGEERDVEVHSFPVKTHKEELLFSIIYDISDKIKQELMFERLLVASPFAVVILDKEHKIMNANEDFIKLFQYSLEEIKGRHINPLVSPWGRKKEVDTNINLAYKGEIVKQEGLRRRKDGTLIEVEILGYPIMYHQSVEGVYVIYSDITEKKARERQLLLFRKIMENNSEGVVITDSKGNIEWINKAYVDITGYTLNDVKGENMNILKSGIHNKDFYQKMWKDLNDKGSWQGEIWNRNRQGDIFAGWATIKKIKGDFKDKYHYVGIFKDLSEKKKLDIRMSELQQKDSLTGLYNRNYFLNLIGKYIEDDTSIFTLAVIDIEGFKEINDSLGHLVGDKVLIELSERLKSLMCSECLVSRFEGDEFVLICKDISQDRVDNLLEKLIRKIRKPYKIKNTIIHLNFNVGISRYPRDGEDTQTLIRFANIAMYKAKDKVNESICYYSKEMSEAIEEKFYLANYLAGGLKNNEFYLNFQPIFDINNNTVLGMEALLRWENPSIGNISPGKFIAIAENTGYIISIGEWVIREVCKQINSWKRSGYSLLPVSINVSVKQLELLNFSNKVKEILEENNVDSNLIEFEITESVSSGDIPLIIKNIKRLKKLGIKISMDDFGTGFSSLGQLDIFELDKLKIDKVFIDDIVSVKKRQNLVKSIIAMSKSLNLVVVAEGIETKKQLEILKTLGCDLGQGYLFSKPLEVKDVEKLLSSSKTIAEQ